MMVIVVLSLFLLCGGCLCKECTNIPTQLSSHTVRYELMLSKNETLKKEMFSHYHLTPTDDSTWDGLFPRRILREGDEYSWAMLYRKIKNNGGFQERDEFLREVSLHDVRIDAKSMHGSAQLTNLEYLLLLDVDKMVWNFRKTAGLETTGEPYGGWEAPNSELRGHFVGHYLSASALMWASTHNDSLKEKMFGLVYALSECQEKMGSGYLSAFPSEQFDRFEAIKPVWAPYYTIHKILAGLLDQYTVAGNSRALTMMTWMVDYFYNRVQNVISQYTIERHWKSLNEETGGMNDVLYRLYSITGNATHLLLAQLFDKPCFLGELAVKADDLSGFHANTHIPIVIGSQLRYEVTGEPLYKEIGKYFMEIVNSSHSYATGGTSVGEFWSDPKRLASTLQFENEESCTTYNMLKVSRNLFRWTKELAYADYYERALTNGVLSIQRGTEPGVMIYMLPLGPGTSKARSYHKWGTKFDSFWCCYGTGIESFSKLGDSIYFEQEGQVPSLYIIQYISSTLNWKSGKVMLNHSVDPVFSWDPYLRVTITFSAEEGASQTSSLNLRIPIWTELNGAKAALNAQSLTLPAPGNFLSITRKWSPGDKLTLELPITLRNEAIKDDRPEYGSLQAVLFGPYLLAGISSGDWDIKGVSAMSPADWITPVPESHNYYLVSLLQESKGSILAMSNTNQSITMEKYPEPGTDSSIHATFRVILSETSSLTVPLQKDLVNKTGMLEPFELPGMVLVHQGADENLAIASPDTGEGSSAFHVALGLDGRDDTISFESESQKGCYIYAGTNYDSGTNIKLRCISDSADAESKEGASFVLGKGISEYHPISFMAKGANRNFLLQPLLSLSDESYTVYFNL